MELEDFFKLANKKDTEFSERTFRLDVLSIINHKKLNNISFLYHVIKNDNLSLMKFLIDSYQEKIDLSHLTPSKENFLHIIVSPSMFDLLISTSLKEKLYDKDRKGNTLLHKYISNIDLVKKIKPYFEDINIKNNNGQTPISFFRLEHNVDKFIQTYELFDKKIDLNIENSKGVFMPFALFETYRIKEIKKLIALSIDFSKQDQSGNTLFHFIAKSSDLCHKLAAFENNMEIYDIVNQKNHQNETATLTCIEKKNTSGLEKLIFRGLELNSEEIEKILKFKDNQYEQLFRHIFLYYFCKSNLVFDKIIEGNLVPLIEELREKEKKNSYNLSLKFIDKMKIFETYYEKQKLEQLLEKESNHKRKMKI